MSGVLTIALGVALGVIVGYPVANAVTAVGWVLLDELLFDGR